MSAKQVALDVRFLRVAANWVVHKGVVHREYGEILEYFYAPEVDGNATPQWVEDPWRLRDEFLRMEHTEEAALEFLSQIGVWSAMPGVPPQSNLPKTRLAGTFGYRVLSGLACPLTLEELSSEQ